MDEPLISKDASIDKPAAPLADALESYRANVIAGCENEASNLELAERISQATDNELKALGIENLRSKHQFILELLAVNSDPKADQLRCKSWLALHPETDIKYKEGETFANMIHADRILTPAEFKKLDNFFHMYREELASWTRKMLSYKPNEVDNEEGGYFNAFNEVFLESNPIPTDPAHDKETLEFVIGVFRGIIDKRQKIAVYPQLVFENSQKSIPFLTADLSIPYSRFNENDILMQMITQFHLLKENYVHEPLIHRICLKKALYETINCGVYSHTFDNIDLRMIVWEHSRALSAHRLATIPNTYNSTEMETILKVEYYALPDNDKKDSASMFTSYRHRTLEKTLETIFDREKIIPLSSNEIAKEDNVPLRIAVELLKWIGNQERSFAYKLGLAPKLFMVMKNIGTRTHKIALTFESPSELAKLKGEVIQELDKLHGKYGTTDLINTLNQLLPPNEKSGISPTSN